MEKIARDCGAMIRSRKLKINKCIISTLSVLSNSPNTNNLTMLSVYNVYDKLAEESLGEKLSKKCVHKRLDNDEMVECLKSLLESVSSVIAHTAQKMFKKIVPKDVQLLLKNLGVNDIILIDGTEIDVRPSLAKDEDFKGSNKGRPHLDGEPSRPGIKLHVAYSVAKQTFIYIDVTNACESERAHVLTERFSNCLIIADRGYVSVELEKKINESNNYFIIKGKSNTTGNIDAAFSSNSQLPNLTNQKLKDVEIKETMDFDITSKYYRFPDNNTENTTDNVTQTEQQSNNEDEKKSCFDTHQCRVVRECHLTQNSDENVITLRTNLPRNRVNAKQIFLLYRIRWTVEIFNKVCKSSNTLHSINSGEKTIVYEFIILSIMSNLIKTYFGYLTQISYNIEWISIQKLNKYLTNNVLEKFYAAILHKRKSKIYQIVKELLGLISQNCQRGKPSKRDRERLKDFPLLIQTINNFWNEPKNFSES